MKLFYTIIFLFFSIVAIGQYCPPHVYNFKFSIKGPVINNQEIGRLGGCDEDRDQTLIWDIPNGNIDNIWIIEYGRIVVNDADKINSDNLNTYIITISLTDNGNIPLKSTSQVEIVIIQKVEVNVYPNPFNEQITFEYDLVEYSHVIIQIYDAQGKIINDPIVNEYQSEGKHYYLFNTKIASGVYFYRILINNDYIDFGRIIKKK